MTPRFSVVIPTFQRRELVAAAVSALSRQQYEHPFEVIVVVDGSTDGTAATLRELAVPMPLTVIEQANQGASAARNRGAAAARGDLLLFLDDDMEADGRLLAAHDAWHRGGADVVFGHLPLHPRSPANFLAKGIGEWTDGRLARLTTPGAELTLHDLMTGQMSLARRVFERVGRFDCDFTRNGTFGDEDIDFGYRLMRDGYRLTFNPEAISYQNYVVTPRHYLRQWREAGRADAAFARKHPERGATIFALNGVDKSANRLLWRPLAAMLPLSAPVMELLRVAALWLVRAAQPSDWRVKFFYQVWAMQYWRGVREGGGIPIRPVMRVLTYHAVQDLRDAPIVAPYSVAPTQFRQHVRLLQRAGFRFIDATMFLDYLRRGTPPSPRSILLTFDDAYRDLLDVVPFLEERHVPAVVFAVSQAVGGVNAWDVAIGAPSLTLLDADGLLALSRHNIEIGAHSRTHRPLSTLSEVEMTEEIAGSVADLERQLGARPRLFAYPEGDFDKRVKASARAAALDAAFAVAPGLVRCGDDPFEVPRIEVLSADRGLRFLWKVVRAGRWPRLA